MRWCPAMNNGSDSVGIPSSLSNVLCCVNFWQVTLYLGFIYKMITLVWNDLNDPLQFYDFMVTFLVINSNNGIYVQKGLSQCIVYTNMAWCGPVSLCSFVDGNNNVNSK